MTCAQHSPVGIIHYWNWQWFAPNIVFHISLLQAYLMEYCIQINLREIFAPPNMPNISCWGKKSDAPLSTPFRAQESTTSRRSVTFSFKTNRKSSDNDFFGWIRACSIWALSFLYALDWPYKFFYRFVAASQVELPPKVWNIHVSARMHFQVNNTAKL